MKLYLKYLLRGMWQNKITSLLLLVAIMLSSAVFLSSMGMSNQMISNFEKPYLEATEGHDVFIQPTSPVQFFTTQGMDQNALKQLTPGIKALGIYQDTVNVSLYGQHEAALNTNTLNQGSVMLSHRILELYDLAIGDTITLTLYGTSHNFTIGESTSNQGVFYQDDDKRFALKMPVEDLRALLMAPEDTYNYVIGQVDGDVREHIQLFNANNPGFTADRLYDGQVIERIVSEQRTLFMVMLTIVAFMSSVIIYGTFKLIIAKRLSVIGTFLSQGATRRDIRKVLLLESMLYGISGGLLGSGLGAFILWLLQRMTAPLRAFDIYEPFQLNHSFVFMTFIFAIGLSLASSLLPIIKTRKFQLKALILNTQETEGSINHAKGILGLLLLIIVTAIMFFSDTLALTFAPVLMLVVFMGTILFYPTGMALLFTPLIHLLKKGAGKIGLTLQHVLHIGPIRSNITILIIVMTSVILIVSLGSGLETIVSEAYETLNTDLFIKDIHTVDARSKTEFLERLKSYDFVTDEKVQEEHLTYGNIHENSIMVMGVDSRQYADFNQYIHFQNREGENLLDRLNDAHVPSALLSQKAANRLEIGIGDTIELSVNGFLKDFVIKGLVDAKLYNNGDMIFIEGSLLESHFNMFSSQIYVSVTNSPKVAKEALNAFVTSYGGSVITLDDMQKTNIKNNQSFVDTLGVFSLVAVIIGAFGALNNMFIGYLQRKKTLAILSSLGMSRPSVNWLLIKESLLCFSVAMVVVIASGPLMMQLVSNISYHIGLPLDIRFSLASIFPYILISGLIYVLATIPLILSHRKFDLVKTIRL